MPHTYADWSLSGDLIVGPAYQPPNPKADLCHHPIAKLCWNFDGDRNANGLLIVQAPKMLQVLESVYHQLATDSDLDTITGAAKYTELTRLVGQAIADAERAGIARKPNPASI